MPDNTHRTMVGELVRQQLRPASVVVEVACDQRQIHIAGFTDRLAVVQSLQYREEPRVLLQKTCQRVQNAGPAMSAGCFPGRLRRSCGGYGTVHVRDGCLRYLRKFSGIGRVERCKSFTGNAPGVVDKQSKATLVLIEPGQRFVVAFGGRAVIHGGENLGWFWHGGNG